jgi:hypothetical protein
VVIADTGRSRQTGTSADGWQPFFQCGNGGDPVCGWAGAEAASTLPFWKVQYFQNTIE